MSRSYHKHYNRLGICYGSNTNYYRAGNKALRNKARAILRNVLAHDQDLEEIIFPNKKLEVGFNDWNDPTDGTFLINNSYDYWYKEYSEIYPDYKYWKAKYFSK